MSSSDEHAYYCRRAAEEMKWGDQATNAKVAALHYELATRYAIFAARMETGASNLAFADWQGSTRRLQEHGRLTDRSSSGQANTQCEDYRLENQPFVEHRLVLVSDADDKAASQATPYQVPDQLHR